MFEAGSEDPLVRRHCFVEVLDRNAYVVDPARLHAGDATRL